MLHRLQHVGLIVGDLDASRRFYGDALGLEETARPASFKFAGAWFAVGDDSIHLIAQADSTQAGGPADPGPGAARGLMAHFALEVDALEEVIARMAEHGHTIDVGPLRRGDGVRQIYYRDPDGHYVELYETTGEDQSDEVRLPAHEPG